MTTARSTIYIVGIATGLSLCFALRDSARRRERDQLCIHVRARVSNCFQVELVELTVPPRLRRLVTEHRTNTPEFVALAAQHAI